MGRMYTAIFAGVTVDQIQDLFELNAPSDAVVILHSITLGQDTDYGDADAEGLEVRISRATGSGSGGTAPTARPHEVGSPAFGGTVEVNNTTQATGTTELYVDVFNIQAGWQYRPTPEERFVLSPSGRLVLELTTDPQDSAGVVMSGSITFEEIGG